MQLRQIKEKTLYRGIVCAAWDITWRRREFWPLGFLAALLMMNGGAFEFITRACYKIASGTPYDGIIGMSQTVASAVSSGDSLNRASLFIVVLICLAVYAAIVVLATSAGGGLLKAARELTLRRKLTARAAFSSGMGKIGPLLLTQVVGRLVIFSAFVLAALGAFTTIGNVWGDLAAIALFVIFAIIALTVSFLMMMTDAGIMISGERWVHAAHSAFRFLRRHWLISLEMISFIFLLAVAAALAAVVAAIILLVPFTLLLAALAALHSLGGILFIVFLYEIIILALVILIGAGLAVFERSAWALLYVRLTGNGHSSKIERLWQLARHKLHARFNR
jgi:hypothetical protein